MLPWSSYHRLLRTQPTPALQTMRCCPMCGADQEDELLVLNDFQFYDDSGGDNRADHRVVSCRQCGFVYTNPCYSAAGFERLFAKAGCSYGHSEGRPQEQAQWLATHCDNVHTVIDIGCGMGAFLKSLPGNWQRIGIELDAASVARANADAQGVHFIEADLNGNLSLPEADVITLFHVLEHVPEPQSLLRQLRRNSKDNTRLIVEVPVIDRAMTEQGNDIVGFYSVQHLSHFSISTLNTMLCACGWQPEQVEVMPGYNGYRILALPSQPKKLTMNQQQMASDRQRVEEYLSVWRTNVERIKSRLAALKQDTRIMLWGAGQHSEYLSLLTGLFSSERRYLIVDSDSLKQGTTYHGIPVFAPQDIPDMIWKQDDFPIVISSYGSQQAIEQMLLAKGVAPSRIVTLYDRINRY